MTHPQRKVVFRLVQDEDGYPPATTESVWAREAPSGYYKLDNIPFFEAAATLDDIVEASKQDGELVFVRMVRESDNSLIRVVYYEGTDPRFIRDELEDLGCSTEWMEQYSLVAVSIPSNVALAAVQHFLEEGAAQDKWDYEEAILRQ